MRCFVLLLLVTLASCAPTPDADASLITSVSAPGALLRKGSTVGLLPESGVDGGDTIPGAEARLVGMVIEAAMRDELQARGLRPAAPGDTPDLWFSYLAAQTEDVDPREAIQRFGLHEAGGAWPDSLPTGTILVMLVDSRTRTPLWRASTQVELRRELPMETRRARIEHHVGRLFGSCPVPR